MKQEKKESGNTKTMILLIWAVACCVAAFFIPHYDFGFDGVKIWFYLCLLMLAGMSGGAVLFQSLHRRRRAHRPS